MSYILYNIFLHCQFINIKFALFLLIKYKGLIYFIYFCPLSNVTLSLHPLNFIDNLPYFLYNNLILKFNNSTKLFQGDRL